MIEVKVRTIWHGKVGIPQKYVYQAEEQKQDLMISKGEDVMILKFDKIEKLIKGRSDNSFKDKFGGEDYYLVYFDWRPDTIQQGLFE
jgi:hypothetical protein